MPSFNPLALAIAAGAGLVAAHGHVQEIKINGQTYQGYPASSAPYENPKVSRIAWADTATDNGFVGPEAYGTSDIACHRGSAPGALSAKVAAGDKVELFWDTWPTSHKGPVIDYMAACDGDCTKASPGALNFFKIAEAGLVDGSVAPGKYASDDLVANNNSWTATIPATLKAGNYVLRHEIIALHSAGQENGAQNYPQCINLEVTGSGSELPTGTPATKLYTASDAGIKFNIYQKLDSYPIPGPKLAFAAGSSKAGSGAAAPVSSAPAASAPAKTSSAPAAPAKASSSAAPAKPSTKPCKKRRHARQVAAAGL
ncbi:endoglucanase [Apiospora saccharicola]|uniref:lytic cellulose monooxygenase (C4-dehydrogenating) n=1 Tax=Apiospora saccharicola TaxID=335842 RepID=A0ABR1W030_9PEZI